MSSTLPQPRVAFLGLGLMGTGMAQRLLRAGFPLTVYNRNIAKAHAPEFAGSRVAATPREAAVDADVIISMLADDPAARSCWLGADGALPAARKGTLFIESSTVSVDWIHDLGAAAKAKDSELLDAPVTGSKLQAAAGELSFIVGGSAAAYERARPLFAAMGRSSRHVGAAGSGALLKLINNFLCGVQAASAAEAIALIEKSGLDPKIALEVLTNGAPASPLFKTVTPRMTQPDYTPHFHLRLMAKDLAYAAEEGAKRSVPLATAAAALSVFNKAIAGGFGEKDMSAVVEPFRDSHKSSE